jgi:hypothetical protein
MKKCAICHSPAMIPVQFECFGCKCSESNVSCRTCADNYLELNTSSSRRKNEAKCPNCEKTCHTYFTKRSAYKVNTILMEMDTSKYSCPPPCGFEGKHWDFFSHLGCPNSLVECRECNDWYIQYKKQEHDLVCRAYTTCESCSQRIKTTDYKRHVEGHGGHKCSLCREYSFKSPTEHKMTECAYREKCPYCEQIVLARNTTDHYKTHHDYYQKLYDSYDSLMQTLTDNTNQNFNHEFQHDTTRQMRWLGKERWYAEQQIHNMRMF